MIALSFVISDKWQTDSRPFFKLTDPEIFWRFEGLLADVALEVLAFDVDQDVTGGQIFGGVVLVAFLASTKKSSSMI